MSEPAQARSGSDEIPEGRNWGRGLIEVRAGRYFHLSSGRYIVQTDGWEGPRDGNRRYWEQAIEIGSDLTISTFDLYGTLREACAALDNSTVEL
jgi:hypothetical protein